MKYAFAAALFVATVSAVPQDSSGLTGLLSQLPPCSITCATKQLPAVTACQSKGGDLVTCLCEDQQFQNDFATCAKSPGNCDAAGQCSLYTASVAQCKGKIPNTDNIPKPEGSCGGSTGGGSSSSSAAPAPPAETSTEAAPPAETSTEAAAPTETSAAAPAATTTAAAGGSGSTPTYGGNSTTSSSAPGASFSSSASSVLISGSSIVLAGLAAMLLL